MNNPQNTPPPADTDASDPPGATVVIRNVRTLEGLARFAGDQERYRHWLGEFIAYGSAAAAEIRQAITGGATGTAINLTHTFKGRTGMLGMVELHSIAQSLEMALKNGEPASLWLEELERTTEEMCKEIARVLRGKAP